MSRVKILTATLLIVAASSMAVGQKIVREQLEAAGKKRTYYLFVPQDLKDAKVPLVVLLHGSNRNGLSLAEKWKDLAVKENLILLAPDSADPAKWAVPGDGPKALYELIEAIKAKYPVNPKRVYMFGHSGGAIFALNMSLYESEYFAASAIHAGAMYQESLPLLDLAKRKIPLYLTVGSRDPLFPVDVVRATRDALTAKGFPVNLVEIPGHDHWYYDLAPQINDAAWQFLKTHELPSEPRYDEYTFRSDDSKSRSALKEYNRGIEFQRSGNFAGAIEAYTRAIEIDAKYAAAFNNRGIARMGINDAAGAVADFSRSLELEPSEVVYNNRAGAYFAQKKYAEAIADFTEGLRLKASAPGFANRGLAYEQMGDQAKALADYESSIKTDPKFGRAYALRGLITLRAGQSEAAQKDFDKAFQLDPALHAEFDPVIRQFQTRP